MELATGIGRYPCEHIIDSLSALEKDADKKICDSLTFWKWRSWSWCDSSTSFFCEQEESKLPVAHTKVCGEQKETLSGCDALSCEGFGNLWEGRLYCFENFALSNRKRTEFRQLRTHRRLWTVACWVELWHLPNVCYSQMALRVTKVLWRSWKWRFSTVRPCVRRSSGRWRHAPKQGILRLLEPCA